MNLYAALSLALTLPGILAQSAPALPIERGLWAHIRPGSSCSDAMTLLSYDGDSWGSVSVDKNGYANVESSPLTKATRLESGFTSFETESDAGEALSDFAPDEIRSTAPGRATFRMEDFEGRREEHRLQLCRPATLGAKMRELIRGEASSLLELR